MQKAAQKLWIVFSLFLCLTACGFHLRGATFLPPGLNSMYIDASPYDPFTSLLTQNIRSAGVTLAPTMQTAQVTLQVLAQSFSQQLTSISGNTLVSTYNLVYSVTFQLLNRSGQVIYGPLTVQATMPFAASDKQVLGDNSLFASRQQTLRQEAVSLVFNRLSAQQAKIAIENNLK